jgi:hypothetical protein
LNHKKYWAIELMRVRVAVPPAPSALRTWQRPRADLPPVHHLWGHDHHRTGLGSTDPLTGMVADWTGMIITADVGGRPLAQEFFRSP